MRSAQHGNNFNLLRFLFAALVIVSHAPELQDGDRSNELLSRLFGSISFGDLAVDSFFILSGFLIVKSWVSQPRVGCFLASRLLRIYPGFIAASLFCAFVVGPLYGGADYFQQFWWGGFVSGLARLELVVTNPVFAGTAYPFSKDFPVKHRFSMTGRQAGFPFLPTCVSLPGAARARRIGQTDCLSLIGLDRVSPGAMRLTAPAGLDPTSAGSGGGDQPPSFLIRHWVSQVPCWSV